MADIVNGAFQPIADYMHVWLDRLEIVLGGIFGLYLIMILFKIYYMRRQSRMMKEIREDFKSISQKIEKLEKRKK